MIRIKIKGVYTLNEALEVLKILQKEETTDGVGFRLKDGETETLEHIGEYNNYRIVYNKKDILNIEVEKNGGLKNE